MSSSVINGAIGKSPLIDKINQLAAAEVKNKAITQMEQQIYGGTTVRYPSVPVSFPKCREEMKKQMIKCREEGWDKDDAF